MIAEDVRTQTCLEEAPISILGVAFDHLATQTALDRIEQMIESGRPHYGVTANVDFVVQAQRDVELHRILFDAHLVLCDGTPLVWASHLLGNRLPERVAGSDLVPLLIRLAAKTDRRIFFLGASPEVASEAAGRLRRQYPNLVFEFYSPPFSHLLEMDHEEIINRIAALRPHMLFVALGCPKQEKWIAMHYRSLGVPISIGVGATVDFLAGHMKRAPRWMQRCGTEWLFRLVQEPRRLYKRYATDLRVFGSRLLAQWWHLQRTRRAVPAKGRLHVRATEEYLHLQPPSRLDVNTVRANAKILRGASADHRHCLMNLAKVSFIDSTGVGELSRLQKRLSSAGRRLILIAPTRPVMKALKLMRLDHLFATAANVTAATQLIASRDNEQTHPVWQRTAAAGNPLLWRGEITARNAAEVWNQMRTRLSSRYCPERLVVDCSTVRFLDSSGVNVMLRAMRLAGQRGIKLSFTSIPPLVENVLRVARFESLARRHTKYETAPQPAPMPQLALSRQQT